MEIISILFQDLSAIFKHTFFHLLVNHFHLPCRCIFSNNPIHRLTESIGVCKCYLAFGYRKKAHYKKYRENAARKGAYWNNMFQQLKTDVIKRNMK